MSISPFSSDTSKPVCVFCGSSPGNSPLYTTSAQAVGEALAKAGIPLVYGGGRRGIMGVVSHSALKEGGYVHGIVPRALTGRASERTLAPSAPSVSANGTVASTEGQGEDLLEDDFGGRLTTEIVGSMHERKLKMAQLSTGGFVVLPGGYGTFEEALEMATWNQLGIHRLPLIILNIGNFYTHLKKQFEVASEAGFIAPQNLSLLKIVDLPGGEEANSDESKAQQWGEVAVKALKEFTFAADTGYGLDWKDAKINNRTSTTTTVSASTDLTNRPSALFTTMRYTSTSDTNTITKESIPLLRIHIERLKEAHEYFSSKDKKWGEWMGDEIVWDKLKMALEEKDKIERGDWRVRTVIHPCKIDALGVGPTLKIIQILPAPEGAGPFVFLPSSTPSAKRRPLMVDPENTNSATLISEREARLYKTTNRDFYDQAQERGSRIHKGKGVEVLLHSEGHLLETTTSNIAIATDPSGREWLTPKLTDDKPFLNGVMRRHLLRNGIIREAPLTIADLLKAKEEGRRVIGFNGLRGAWEAELL